MSNNSGCVDVAIDHVHALCDIAVASHRGLVEHFEIELWSDFPAMGMPWNGIDVNAWSTLLGIFQVTSMIAS